jgi:hypothetical protein
MAALFAAFMFLGLRERTHRGSTHLTIVVISGLVLGYAYFGLGRAG